ncbi:hypothetical protein [Luteibacter sp. 9135]|uniref:hypothetical protein n=1 Tax=Luteibacter sp. 9135 TaxID=1500893 RepID=UPI00163A9844|nr:hypothetical protein [Luteibacter sp. 9135]
MALATSIGAAAWEHARYTALVSERDAANSRAVTADARFTDVQGRLETTRSSLDACYVEKERALSNVFKQSESAGQLAACQTSLMEVQRRDSFGQQIRELRAEARELDKELEGSPLAALIGGNTAPSAAEEQRVDLLVGRREAVHELLKASFEHCPH